MAQRLINDDIFKDPFVRSLPNDYKLLWLYIWFDCSRAGIWVVDFQVAKFYFDDYIDFDESTALKLFNSGKERVIAVDDGNSWFVLPFLKLNFPNGLQGKNPSKNPIISALKEYGLERFI